MTYNALPPGAILPAVLGALVRGRVGVIPELVAQGRRAAAYRRVLRERIRLVEAAADGRGPA